MTKEEIVKYVMQSPENTNPNVLEGMLDELDNGGSGSSDFSIAQVEIQITTQINGYSVAIIDDEYQDIFPIINNSNLGSEVLNVPIYKNGSIMRLDTDGKTVVIETTGDIIYDDNRSEFRITGNGTITISDIK